MLENHCSAKVKRVPMLLKQRLGRDFGSSYDRLAQIEVVLMTTVGVTEYLIGLESLPEFVRRSPTANVWMVSSRERAKSAMNRSRVCAARHAQNCIVVLQHPATPTSPQALLGYTSSRGFAVITSRGTRDLQRPAQSLDWTQALLLLAAAHPHPSAHQNADVLASGQVFDAAEKRPAIGDCQL